MKKYIYLSVIVISLMSTILLFNACQNEGVDSSVQANDKEWKITNKEHAAMIDITTADFKSSIEQSLREKSTSKNVNFPTANRLMQIFEEKCTKRQENSKQVTSKNIIEESSFIMEDEKLQLYLKELSERITIYDDSISANPNIEKEVYLIGYKKLINDYKNEVYNDSKLIDKEKQVVLENITLTTNVTTLVIEHGENLIASETSNTSRCWWLCKVIKIIRCTNKSLEAAATCYLAYEVKVSFWLWAECGVRVASAVYCWATI